MAFSIVTYQYGHWEATLMISFNLARIVNSQIINFLITLSDLVVRHLKIGDNFGIVAIRTMRSSNIRGLVKTCERKILREHTQICLIFLRFSTRILRISPRCRRPAFWFPVLPSSTLSNHPRILFPFLPADSVLLLYFYHFLRSTDTLPLPSLSLSPYRSSNLPVPNAQLLIAPPGLIIHRRLCRPALIRSTSKLLQLGLPRDVGLEFRDRGRGGAGVTQPLVPLDGDLDV